LRSSGGAIIGGTVAKRLKRFGDFVFDLDSLELSRSGRTCRLQPQPARVLAALVANAGRIVTRDELRSAVWRDDTFVDFDRGLNFCIAQIRAALHDSPDTPRFIRTLPKRGYEFICPFDVDDDDVGRAIAAPAPSQPAAPAGTAPRRSIAVMGWVAAAALLLAAVSATFLLRRPNPPIVAVARFDNETGDAGFAGFSDQLTSEVIDQLTTGAAGRFGVVGNASILRVDRNARDLLAIGRALRAAYIVIGQVQRDSDGRVRVLAHLIRLPDQTHVSVSRTDGLTDSSLPSVDAVASRIASNFVTRLASLSAGSTSVAPATH
jgi:DNA-binding winged helix-turn-helix (wHTH) protein/TolB-like protein